MLEVFLELTVGLLRGIRRYRLDLGMYAGDYFGTRGWRKKFVKNKIS